MSIYNFGIQDCEKYIPQQSTHTKETQNDAVYINRNKQLSTKYRSQQLTPEINRLLQINLYPALYNVVLDLRFLLVLLALISLLLYIIMRNRKEQTEENVREQNKIRERSNNLQHIFLKGITEPLLIFNSEHEITLSNESYTSMISNKDQLLNSIKTGIQEVTDNKLRTLDSELFINEKNYQVKYNRIVFDDRDYSIVVLIKDTTKIKTAEYALRQNEILFRSYFEKSPIGIVYVMNPLDPISNCNQKFCEMMNLEKSEVLTKTMMALTYGPDLERDIANFENAIQNKTTYLFEPNKRLLCPDNKVVTTETHVTFIYNDKNEYQYMFALLNDVTEQRENLKNLIEARTQLIQSEKLASLGQITAGVAHEINNPVNFIYNGVNNLKTLIEILKNKHNTEDLVTVYEDIQQMIDAVEDGAKRTAAIVKSLRLFTRQDTNNMTSYDIISGIESTLTLLSNKITEGVSIRKDYSDTELYINCYPGQLNQVFMNLILNAIEAIETTGTIVIKIEQNDTTLSINIEDSGIGIEDSVSGSIFEPFFSTKGPINGTGLGLSISNTIIKKHKGAITFAQNKPKGTICTISIPISLS